MTEVDYCITTMDRPQALERLLFSIAARRPAAAVHVADQSERFDAAFHQRLAERLAEAGLVERPVVHRLPFDCGVSAARNHLADVTPGEYKLLMDDDLVFGDDTDVEALVRLLEAHAEAGAVGGDVVHRGNSRLSGCRLVKENGTLHQLQADEPLEEHEGIRFRRTDCVPLFVLLRRELCEQVRWDPELKTGGEHFDFFLRVRETLFTVLHTPDVTVEHPPAEAEPSYRSRRLRGEFLRSMLLKHGLRRQRAIGGAIFELDPGDELIAYCDLDRASRSRR